MLVVSILNARKLRKGNRDFWPKDVDQSWLCYTLGENNVTSSRSHNILQSESTTFAHVKQALTAALHA